MANVLEKIEKNIEEVAKSMGISTEQLKKFIDATKNSTDALKNQGNEFDRNAKNIKDYGERVGNIVNGLTDFKTKIVEVSMVLQAPHAALMRMNDAFSKSFKTIADFDNQIYQSSMRLKVLGTGFGSLTSIQAQYIKDVKSISDQTKLTEQDSRKLFDSMLSGHKGKMDSSVVNSYKEITTAVAQLGGTFEEAMKKAQVLTSESQKYVEVQKAMAAAAKGAEDKGSLISMFAGYMNGNVSEDALDAVIGMRENQADLGRTSRGNSTAFNTSADQQKSLANSEFAKERATTENTLAQNMMKVSTSLNNFTKAHSTTMAHLDVTNKYLGILSAGIMATVGGSGLLSLFKKKTIASPNNNSPSEKIKEMAGNVLGGSSSGSGTPVVLVGIASGVLKEFGGYGSGFSSSGKNPQNPEEPGKNGRKGSGFVGRFGAMAAAGALAGGMAAYGEYSERKAEGDPHEIAKAAITGASVLIPTVALGLIPVVGPALTMIAGPILGTWLGSFINKKSFGAEDEKRKNDAAAEEKRKADELAKLENNNKATGTTGASGIGGILEKMKADFQQMSRETRLTLDLFGSISSAQSGLANSLSSIIGYGDQAAVAFSRSAQSLDKMSVASGKMAQLQLGMADQLEKTANAMPEGIAKTEALEAATAVRGLAEKSAAESTLKHIEAMNAEMKAKTVQTDQIIASLGAVTSLSQAQRDLHTEMRMGIGQSYADTVSVVKNLRNEMAAMYSKANQLKELAAATTDAAYADKLRMDAIKAETEAVTKEKQMYSEAKAMREGYLNALMSEMSNTGSFAKIFIKRNFGNQNFENSMALGGVLKGGSDITAPTKYTTGGIKFPGSGGADTYNKTMSRLSPDRDLTNDLNKIIVPGDKDDQAAMAKEGWSPNKNDTSSKVITGLKDIDKNVARGGSTSNPQYVSIVNGGGGNGGYSVGSSGTSGSSVIPNRTINSIILPSEPSDLEKAKEKLALLNKAVVLKEKAISDYDQDDIMKRNDKSFSRWGNYGFPTTKGAVYSSEHPSRDTADRTGLFDDRNQTIMQRNAAQKAVESLSVIDNKQKKSGLEKEEYADFTAISRQAQSEVDNGTLYTGGKTKEERIEDILKRNPLNQREGVEREVESERNNLIYKIEQEKKSNLWANVKKGDPGAGFIPQGSSPSGGNVAVVDSGKSASTNTSGMQGSSSGGGKTSNTDINNTVKAINSARESLGVAANSLQQLGTNISSGATGRATGSGAPGS